MDESLQTLESLSGALWYNNWLKDQFKAFLRGEILEVGCGIGNFTKQLSAYGRVTAIDINKKYLQKIKVKNIKVGLGDIEKGQYFFKDKSFNTIVCINVLEHIKNENKALNNLYKLLKPGGNLVLLVPSQKKLYGEIDKAIFHYRRYEKEKLKKLISKHNFNVTYLRRLNFLGGVGWFIAGRILKNVSVDKNKIFLFNLIGPAFLFLEKIFEPPVGTSLLLIAQKDF